MTRAAPVRPLTVAGLAVVATALLLSVPSLLGTVGQLALGVPLLLVFPGYVVTRLLFGAAGDGPAGRAASRFDLDQWRGPVTVALTVGFSMVIVPVLVRVVMATVGYSRTNVVLTVAGFVVLAGIAGEFLTAGTAAGRRSTGAALRSLPGRARSYLGGGTGTSAVTGVLLVVSVLFFLSTVGFALSGSPGGEAYTEFYLLTENESGDLVASDYPTERVGDGEIRLAAGIGNNEGETTTYAIVAEEQRVDNGSVVEEREVFRTRQTVGAGENATVRHRVVTRLSGDDVRLRYFLYRGDAPADATAESAYRTVHLSGTGAA